ncbi:nucleolar protein 10 [Pycnococcus provasolii]
MATSSSGVRVTTADNGVRVYSVAAAKSLPEWLREKQLKTKRALSRRHADYANRVELIQDLGFPSSCSLLKLTPDGAFLLAAGTHKPQIRCFELGELSMKWSRHLNADAVQMQCLSSDYAKFAVLMVDRTLALHAKYGQHFSTRLAMAARDMAYDPFDATMWFVGPTNSLHALNLEEGRFVEPRPLNAMRDADGGGACLGISKQHGLLAAGRDDGLVDIFDPRTPPGGSAGPAALDVAPTVRAALLGTNDVQARGGVMPEAVTRVRFDDATSCAVGTQSGHVLLYDLRRKAPLHVKDHMFGQPITAIRFHEPHLGAAAASDGSFGKLVVSSDTRAVRLWSAVDGRNYTTIEAGRGVGSGASAASGSSTASAPAHINTTCVWPGSGLIFAALDASTTGTFFVPSLGPAPRWCRFLEGLTEELEETDAPVLYDDFRFVTSSDVTMLGLNHLVGTSALRAHLHGYLMDARLHRKALEATDPFMREKYIQRQVELQVEKERQSRIVPKAAMRQRLKASLGGTAPKVNADLAKRLLTVAEDGAAAKDGGDDEDGITRKKARKMRVAAEAAKAVLDDERFRDMFTNEDYAINTESDEFRSLHPNAVGEPIRKRRQDSDDEDDESSSDEDGEDL